LGFRATVGSDMKADALRTQVIDKVLGGTDFTPPATYYVALYTVAPDESGGGTECTGGSYARVAIANNPTNFPGATNGVKSNGTLIQFPTATALWGDVVAWGLHSHATNEALELWGVLDDTVTVDVDDTPGFAAGTLIFAEL
jgi:hypothetical protein